MVVPYIHRKFGADWPKQLGGDSPPTDEQTDRQSTGIPLNLSRANNTRYSSCSFKILNCAAIAAQFGILNEQKK